MLAKKYFMIEQARETENKLWHTRTTEQAIFEIKSQPTGLSQTEAVKRALEYGANEIHAAKSISPWKILLRQFKNILTVILLVATVISLFLGHGIESIAIAVIILFSVLLGFIQEYRAEHAIEALREMAAPTASVLRNGMEVEVPAQSLVPGDIIILRTGDRIPADARLLEAVNLQIEEAALTGESLPVEKHNQQLSGNDLPVGDRKIRVVMITGDHPVTAYSVAQELGLLKTGRVVTGAELDAMADEQFQREVETIDVYARVSPAHKLRVVTALQANGHIVAMTGDGINDAPSLKKSDIGIAMGITGTDVTKEAATMMLTDDNFASIVAAVEEGRGYLKTSRNI